MTRLAFAGAAVAAVMVAAGYGPVFGAVAEPGGRPEAVPSFAGAWMMADDRKFAPTGVGPGPVVDDPAHVHRGRGRGKNGRDTGTTPWVGDWRNPNLTPWAAEAVKKAGDDDLEGHRKPTAESSCWPAGVPNIMNFFEPVFFVQRPDEIVILYQRGPNVRHIYLNRPHSAHPKPSWYGESVGHYEGDTLVVDTIGFNDRTVLDSYMTPHSDQLHVIERYHLVKDAPKGKAEAQGDGFVYSGETLRIDFTIEDPKAFKKPFSAIAKYRHVNQAALQESICAENNTDLFTGKTFPIPIADKADF